MPNNVCENFAFEMSSYLTYFMQFHMIKGAQYSLVIYEVLAAMGFFFPAGVQDETLKEKSQRLAS